MRTAFDYAARMATLIAQVDADVVALVPGANMVYFTGLHYHLSERPIIAFITADGVSFLVPQLEETKLHAHLELNPQTFVWSDTDGYRDALAAAVRTLGLDNDSRLAVDGQSMRVFEWLALSEAGAHMNRAQDAGQTLLAIRAIKTEAEIEAMREAVKRSETALEKTLAQIKPGMTERQVAGILSDELTAAGSRHHAFPPLVLTGAKSALPHGNTGDEVVEAGDFLLFDFGGTHDDYPADITRTFCVGNPTDEMRQIYETVRRANEAARQIAGPGVTCGVVDKAARDVIEQAGYGQYFTHRTGHGLGIDVHELPQIAAGVTQELRPGMVFTIEPGIYVPGLGGVRIEDNVVVTETGIETLTSFDRNLRKLPV